MSETQSTDFGFEEVSPTEKTRRVGEVFSSVASNYDLMNDLMSFGVHRLWKRYAVNIARVKPNANILDLAGGTGDLATLFKPLLGDEGNIVVCDINQAMLMEGRDRLLDKGHFSGIEFVQANAEILPFSNNHFDLVSIAFGLRNVTDKAKALRSMFKTLKYGGRVIILEFSKVVLPVLAKLYDTYSFQCIPLMGKLIAQDEDSYRYLVESIRMHPDQETLKTMLEEAGFSRIDYHNLSGGAVAVHIGHKL